MSVTRAGALRSALAAANPPKPPPTITICGIALLIAFLSGSSDSSAGWHELARAYPCHPDCAEVRDAPAMLSRSSRHRRRIAVCSQMEKSDKGLVFFVRE